LLKGLGWDRMCEVEKSPEGKDGGGGSTAAPGELDVLCRESAHKTARDPRILVCAATVYIVMNAQEA
jgi:hypothetical protein